MYIYVYIYIYVYMYICIYIYMTSVWSALLRGAPSLRDYANVDRAFVDLLEQVRDL